MRRRLRMPCTGSGPGSSCHASGSSPSSSDGASGPVTTGGLFSAKPCMIVPPAFQPAHRSACCSSASPSGASLCMGLRCFASDQVPACALACWGA